MTDIDSGCDEGVPGLDNRGVLGPVGQGSIRDTSWVAPVGWDSSAALVTTWTWLALPSGREHGMGTTCSLRCDFGIRDLRAGRRLGSHGYGASSPKK
jgi:hypothetical protein